MRIGGTNLVRLAAKLAPFIAFVVLLAAYEAIFGQFFPNRGGRIGHDYSYALPLLLAGDYWFQTNGLWDVPWFTPAFCGGQPLFADPQSFYYSAVQLLTLFVDPLASVHATLLLFAALGFWGFYLLLRKAFSASRAAAVLAATLFMFNGFFSHRMIVGHITYHGFMLVPWMALFLIGPIRTTRRRRLLDAAAGCAAGMVGAYWFLSGLGTLLVPAMLAVVLIVLVHGAGMARDHAARLFVRSTAGLCTMIALSAAKLAASLSFLSHFARADYLLPGYQNIAAAFRIALLDLFVSPPDIEQRSNALLTNVQWAVARHELEYGVTIVPLLIVGLAACAYLWRLVKRKAAFSFARPPLVPVALCAAILLLPVVLNVYEPGWNAFLKQIPLLKSTSTFVRWHIVYIPFFALVAALVLERGLQPLHISAAVVGVALVVAFNLMQDRRHYANEPYDPNAIVHAYRKLRAGAVVPAVDYIGVHRDAGGRIVLPIDRNDGMTQGYSAMGCYNPVFGYVLESFPRGQLHPGRVDEVGNGRYNVKNPACYVYPAENGCSPGDHFLAGQSRAMNDFVSYRPFDYQVSVIQRVANAVTESGIVAGLILVVAAVVTRRRR